MKKVAAKSEGGAAKKAKGKRKLYAAVVLAMLAILAAYVYMISAPRPPGPAGNYTVSVDDDPMLGNADAKVTIVEFSDFECPFCGAFARNTLPQIKADYIDSGKARFVFRDFIVHPASRLAAEASECAHEQDNGKYWLYSEKLFNNQASLDADSLKKYAGETGINTTRFDACLSSGKYADEVKKDERDGASYGVRGTPTFFVNGVKLVGNQPYDVFRRAIEAALNA